MAPVGITSIRTFESAPIFMMDPLPQLFSICAIARFSAFFFSSCPLLLFLHLPLLTFLAFPCFF